MFGFGAAITAAALPIHRHYMLLTFPFMYVWPAGDRAAGGPPIRVVGRDAPGRLYLPRWCCYSPPATVGFLRLHPCANQRTTPRRLRDALRGPGAVRPTAEVSRVGAQRASMDAATPGGLSLVIPAFNEARSHEAAPISRSGGKARAPLHPLRGVLVVDDGKLPMRPADIARPRSQEQAHTRHPPAQKRIAEVTAARGCATALRGRPRFELVAFTDADCQFDLTDLARLMFWVAEGFLGRGRLSCRPREDPWRRRFLVVGVQRACLGALLATRGYAT